MTLKVLALGGDGIGPEVVDASVKLLDVAAQSIALGTESSVGPPLTGIGQRLTSEEIRRSIVDPNAMVAEGFFPNVMPADFADRMTARELEMLVVFLGEQGG